MPAGLLQDNIIHGRFLAELTQEVVSDLEVGCCCCCCCCCCWWVAFAAASNGCLLLNHQAALQRKRLMCADQTGAAAFYSHP